MKIGFKPAAQAVFAVATLSLGLSTGCAATPDTSATVSPTQPPYTEWVGTDQFGPAGVHTFLENQCGTLDCHGEVGRPFRIYSLNGLRIANDAGQPASVAESSDELFQTYLSAISLEPEEMTRVLDHQDKPTSLLLLTKPLGLDKHKGGTRMIATPSDPTYECLLGWLTGAFDAGQCNAAGQLL